MSAQNVSASAVSTSRPNGAGAAAILAAGIGAFLVAAFAILADQNPAIKRMMIFSKSTGPLSGVTTCALVLWLASWAVLHARWRNQNVALSRINAVAFALLILGFLLTFPPIADLF
jgi:integral membrane sensor domain MASE1